MSTLPKVIVIVGPTASGKSTLGIKLAQKYNGEIISADSRQIYREMNVGTAKPIRDHANTKRINANKSRIGNVGLARNSHTLAFYLHGVPHHLLDIKNPNEEYSVAEYKKEAIDRIFEIIRRKKLPIIVGGTGLYIKAVADNLKIPEVKANPKLRAELELELKEKGIEHLYSKLLKLDPEAAYIIDPKNPRRVIRALEITIESQKPYSAQRQKGEPLFDALKIGLGIPKTKLKRKLEIRVDQMVQNGLVEEVQQLIRRYPLDTPAFEAIGYRELIAYFKLKKSLKDAIEEIKQNTWLYAKRQMTWFRADKEIKWIKNQTEAFRLVKKFLKNRA